MSKPRVLLCSIDGARPDAIQQAHTPVIGRLAREGAHTWNARTVLPSVTLPCHTSMLRGVEPARHGITSNVFQPLARPVPSLIDVAHTHGRQVGFFYNWEELRDLASPGTLAVSVMGRAHDFREGDDYVTDHAIMSLERYDLDLIFLYLGGTDECGHKFGWMSDEYLKTIENADACLGRLLEAIERKGWLPDTTTLLISDHGGHDRTHGSDAPEDITIPWVLHGRGVRAGHTIEREVRIFDTCPTLAHLLGLERRPEWDGVVVDEALAE